MRVIIIPAALSGFLVSCTTSTATTAPTLHQVSQLRTDLAYICMAPDGTTASEIIEGSSVTCPPPARFVSQPFCNIVPAASRDNLGYFRARAVAARDGSLQGDTFEGQPFCAVPLRGPPRAQSAHPAMSSMDRSRQSATRPPSRLGSFR